MTHAISELWLVLTPFLSIQTSAFNDRKGLDKISPLCCTHTCCVAVTLCTTVLHLDVSSYKQSKSIAIAPVHPAQGPPSKGTSKIMQYGTRILQQEK